MESLELIVIPLGTPTLDRVGRVGPGRHGGGAPAMCVRPLMSALILRSIDSLRVVESPISHQGEGTNNNLTTVPESADPIPSQRTLLFFEAALGRICSTRIYVNNKESCETTCGYMCRYHCAHQNRTRWLQDCPKTADCKGFLKPFRKADLKHLFSKACASI